MRMMAVYILIVTTVSVSCVHHYHSELTTAENMLNNHPDSSIVIIKRLDTHITDKYEKAFSLYIKTCASAKLGIPITWVEEMESLAPFFEAKANSRHKALYYYYLGFSEKENHHMPAAVASFLKSLEFQDHTHADLLLQQTYANLHFCYYEQNLREDALQILDKLNDISTKLKDTLMLSWANYYQANIYICQNNPDKAKSVLKKAVRMALNIDNKTILGYCYHGYTTLSLEEGDISSALHYNNLAKELSPEMQDDLNWIFMRGRIFAAQGVQDSAVHYLTKAMQSSDTERRYWATRYLFNLSKQDSGYAYLGIYADSLLYYHDLFENQNAQAAIKAAIAQHQNELNTRQSHQLQQTWMLIVIIVAAIGMGTYLYIKHKSGNEMKELRRQLQKMKEQKYQLYYSTEGNNVSDFVSYDNLTHEAPTAWTEVVMTLPENTKYFAIRCVSTNSFMFMIDDITYVPANNKVQLSLKGYNVYRDGVLVNSEPLNDTNYTEEWSEFQTHTYSVSAVYDLGESAAIGRLMFDPATVGISSIASASHKFKCANGNLYITHTGSSSVSVLTPLGIVLHRGIGDAVVALPAGERVVILMIDNKAYKVWVR